MIELIPTIDRENFIVNIQAAFKNTATTARKLFRARTLRNLLRKTAQRFWTLSATEKLLVAWSS